jgi:hypothetical protein
MKDLQNEVIAIAIHQPVQFIDHPVIVRAYAVYTRHNSANLGIQAPEHLRVMGQHNFLQVCRKEVLKHTPGLDRNSIGGFHN